MLRKFGRSFLFLLVLMASTAPFTHASSLDLDLNIDSGFTTEQIAIFGQAENYWETVLTGYQAGITINSVSVDVGIMTVADGADGQGGVLGYGGPNTITTQGGFTLTTSGIMAYDKADLDVMADWDLYDTIVHELAHVLGFGTLWTYNGLYIDGSFQYTGAAGLAAYQQEYDATATYVPVENDGGPGTAGGHWELDNFPLEMMTGWSHPQSAVVSQTTLASFVDLGYTIDTTNTSAVPEPATFMLFAGGLIALSGLGRRKKEN